MPVEVTGSGCRGQASNAPRVLRCHPRAGGCTALGNRFMHAQSQPADRTERMPLTTRSSMTTNVINESPFADDVRAVAAHNGVAEKTWCRLPLRGR